MRIKHTKNCYSTPQTHVELWFYTINIRITVIQSCIHFKTNKKQWHKMETMIDSILMFLNLCLSVWRRWKKKKGMSFKINTFNQLTSAMILHRLSSPRILYQVYAVVALATSHGAKQTYTIYFLLANGWFSINNQFHL